MLGMKRWLAVALVAAGTTVAGAEQPARPPVCGECRGSVLDSSSLSRILNRARQQESVERDLLKPVSLNIRDCTLQQVVADLHRLSGVNIGLDRLAVEDAGVNLRQLVTVQAENTTMEAALNVLCGQTGLTWTSSCDGVVITVPIRGKLKTVTYYVGDLIVPVPGQNLAVIDTIQGVQIQNPGQTQEAALIQLITEAIAPATWNTACGRGTIQYYPLGLALVVSQSQDVQEQIADLLAALRAKQQEARMYYLHLRAVQSSRRGEPEVLSRPTVGTVLGQAASVQVGQTVPTTGMETMDVGIAFKATLTKLADGRLRLELDYRNTAVESTEDGNLRVPGESLHFVGAVEPGQTLTLPVRRGGRGQVRHWVEVTVTDMPPVENAGASGKRVDATRP